MIFQKTLDYSFSALQLGLGVLLLVILSPFLVLAHKYLHFLLFSPLKTLPRSSSKNPRKDLITDVPIEKETSWLRENDSSESLVEK